MIHRCELPRKRDGAQRALIAGTDRCQQLQVALHVIGIEFGRHFRRRIDGGEEAQAHHGDDHFGRGD